jgi:hypothetical protein
MTNLRQSVAHLATNQTCPKSYLLFTYVINHATTSSASSPHYCYHHILINSQLSISFSLVTEDIEQTILLASLGLTSCLK